MFPRECCSFFCSEHTDIRELNRTFVDIQHLQDWDSAKRVLSRNSFMDELRNYDKEALTTERRKSLKRYVNDENMSVDRLRKVCPS